MTQQEANIQNLWQKIRDKDHPTLMSTLDMEFTHVGADSVKASMPVDSRTVQYYNMLHGGASVALAETLASCAAAVHVDQTKQMIVGLEINANHLRAMRPGEGRVHGVATPVHIGRKTQVWQVEIRNDAGKLVCTSRCTLAVVEKA